MISFWHSRAVGENVVGPRTYLQDFENVVQPHLEGVKSNVVFSTHTEVPPYIANKYSANRVVQVLHSMSYMNNLSGLDQFAVNGLDTVFITHYKALALQINEKTPYAAVYIPMSVDLSRLPTPSQKYNGKIVYYGNLYPEKQFTFAKIFAGFMTGMSVRNFDTLSWGVLNFEGDKRNHQECLHKVMEYDMGIGVGRCAIEMLAMGCKVMIAGDNYGGIIDSDKALATHHEWNFNSKGGSRAEFPEDFAAEIERLESIRYKPDLSKLDMSSYVDKYMDAVLWEFELLKDFYVPF